MCKRLIIIIAALLMLLVMASCSNQAAAPEAPTAQPVEETPTPVIDDPIGVTAEPVTAPINTPPPEPTPITFPVDGYISKEGVNLRAEATIESGIVDVMGENFPVRIVSLQNGWYRLDLDGKTAYVREDMATLGEPPRKHNTYYAKVNVKEAKLYKSPGKNEPSDRTVKEGETVKVLRTLDGYSHIVLDDYLQRYILATEITKITEEQ